MNKIFFSVVGYNAAEIFLIFELKYFHENQFFSKMILTYESGAQENHFDGKKEGQKSRGTIPLRIHRLTSKTGSGKRLTNGHRLGDDHCRFIIIIT